MNRFFTLLLIVSVLFNDCLYAQQATYRTGSFVESAKTVKTIIEKKPIATGSNGKTALLSPPFFSENFASGIPGSWVNVDNAGSGVIWAATTTGAYNTGSSVDGQLNATGTTASNGYIKLDSDSAGPGINENASITTVAINCTGHSTVHLSFNEFFAQYGSSTGMVSASNNNLTWTVVHNAETGLAQDSGTANPNLVDVDISSVASNQPSVFIRFTYVGSYDYWWFVDDVQLYEPSAIDLAVLSIERLNNEYTKIPRKQAAALTLSAQVKNTGINTTSGGSALFEILNAVTNAQVYSQSVNLNSFAPGTIQNVSTLPTFTPPYAGSFKSKITITLTGDGNILNNVLESQPIEVSDSVYSRDDGIIENVQGVGAGPGEDGIAGQNFLVNTQDYLTSVTFYLKDTFSLSATGTPVFFTIHSQLNDTTPPNGPPLIGTTDTLVLFPGSIPAGGAYYTVAVHGGPLQLNPGLYFLGFHEVDLILPMGFSLNNFKNGAVWVHWNSIPTPPAVNGWAKAEDFGFFISYMIRANFGISTGLDDHTPFNSLNIYPNPAKDKITIDIRKPAVNCSVEIINCYGEKVFSKSFTGKTLEVNSRSLANGIYFAKIWCDGSIHVEKIVIAGK